MSHWAGRITRRLSSPLERSKFNIIWRCLSTLFICSWTSVHPNVQTRNGWLARANRLRLMLWMIVAPELVIAWAARQFFAARAIRDKFNEGIPNEPSWKKWTMVHGHFLNMGGLTVVDSSHKGGNFEDGSQDGKVLTFVEYETDFKNRKTFSLPVLTEDEIKDRSEAADLTKILAFLQIMWFLIQCIARHHQRLVLTELELVTATLASLNFFTFAIWWCKPLDVREPIRIYFPPIGEFPSLTAATELATNPTRGPEAISATYVFLEGWKLLKESASAIYRPCLYVEEFLFYMFSILPLNIFYIVTFPVYVLFPWGIILLLKVIKARQFDDDDGSSRIATRMLKTLQRWHYQLSSSIRGPFERRFRSSFRDRGPTFFLSWFLLFPAMFFLLLLVFVLFFPFSLSVLSFSFVFHSIFSIISTSTIHPGAVRVPTFYALKTKSDKFSRMVVFALFGAIFNGLDLFGWKLDHATSIEKTLWRATSLALTTIPFAVAPIDCVLENVPLNGRFGKLVRDGLDLVMTILLVIYVPARLFLIAQAFALLRNQPTKALLTVDWLRYIPHF